MKLTTNMGLKKPEYEELIDIDDINNNMDIIDENFPKSITTDEIDAILNYDFPDDYEGDITESEIQDILNS